MSLISLPSGTPVPHAGAGRVDREALRRELSAAITGEVRFDALSQALYSTDASVYQQKPLGVAIPRTREEVARIVALCARHECPLTMRGGGTSQAGQAIGEGLIVDQSKYCNRLLEVNPGERWARVEPGIVLDELNALLQPHGLRFAPDITTASRATLGGMMANNSSGARSVVYGKTIDHVLEQDVLLSDGSSVHFGPLTPEEWEARSHGESLDARVHRAVGRLGVELRDEVERRFPKVLRRVGGYNLDDFIHAGQARNMARMMVGSEGTLGVVVEAKVRLVPLPRHKAVVAIEFETLLDALGATPAVLAHRPSAVEVMDEFILRHTRENPALDKLRRAFMEGERTTLLCVEFYDDTAEALPPRMQALEADLAARGLRVRCHHALAPADQARIWSLREAALGLSMAMKEDAKSVSFVEDTAVAPERLREYIRRFQDILERHGTTAGIYAHASVGCLHVRPVVNLKTEEGVHMFASIASQVADLVLAFGGALSGEHGDGYVRSPFLERMFGPVLYEAFRTIKRTFDPHGILNPGKIVDPPGLTANLRFGSGYRTPDPPTYFDWTPHGGFGGAVEMCSGVGVCRKKRDGVMCPSYMVTQEEQHTTRGRANVLRLALNGTLEDATPGDEEVKAALSLCLECRACRSECPVGVDVASFKSEFLAGYHGRHGLPLRARLLGNVHDFAKWGSVFPALANLMQESRPARRVLEWMAGIDSRRPLPRLAARTFRRQWQGEANAGALLFVDTFTNYYQPGIGLAAVRVLRAAGCSMGDANNVCCGRPLISQGMLREARELAGANAARFGEEGPPLVFCEPSCLSAIKEDAPALLRGEAQRRARVMAGRAVLWEEFLEGRLASGVRLPLREGPRQILLHGHCHQKSMGLLAPAKALLARVPGATVADPDAGCCGLAGSFGYAKENYEISRAIAGRKLLPAARALAPGAVLVASGTSCRHQVDDFAGLRALHPAELLAQLLDTPT
ncbi:MAG: FAD-binding protein [Bryobacterales bacterium]|nr:FAD-binding protein [Bryobacterales bacterium]